MHIKDIFSKVPKEIYSGLVAIVVAFVSITGIYSLAFPWLGNADQMPHLDYIWEVSQGRLPEFSKGVQYPAIDVKKPIQYVANHPPLYYAIQAPVLKASLEDGNWKRAVALGRGVNIVIGVLCIIAFAWAGWVFSHKNRVFTLALPSVAAFYIGFMLVIGNIMNDSVTILFATLALTLSYLILKKPSKELLMILTVVSAFGMASRAIYLVVLAVSLLAVVAAYLLRSKEKKDILRNSFKGILVASLISLLSFLPSAWFYYRNYHQSGTFYKASHGSNLVTERRKFKPLSNVLVSRKLYTAATVDPLGRIAGRQISVGFTVIAIISAAIWLYRKARWRKYIVNASNPRLLIMTGLLALEFLLVMLGQIDHAWGYGQYSARYFLPALLPVTLIVTLGIYAWGRYTPYILAAFMGTASTLIMWQIGDRLIAERPNFYADALWIDSLRDSIMNNHVPPLLIYVLMIAFVGGLVSFLRVMSGLVSHRISQAKGKTNA